MKAFKTIKTNKVARILAKPYMDWKVSRDHARYLRTPDHFYLQTMRGIHEGKRCFIIGNGPSLRASDLDRLQGEYTFAANRIYKIFDQTQWRPTYYLAVDDKVLKETQQELANYDLGHMFLLYKVCKLSGPTNKMTKIFIRDLLFNTGNIYYDTSKYISEDVSDHFCNGLTVTYEAIQLAIFMGFKEIYLIGVDHNYSRTVDENGNLQIDTTVTEDYFNHKKYETLPTNLNTTRYSYEIAKEYCNNHNVKIYNATRGGKLEVFERVDFDSLFKDN